MEVCGTHTMAIARSGIRSVLPDNIDLLSGPGCPVCVTEPGYIDAAVELAGAGRWIVTFGDMIDVPGSTTTLARARANGARVVPCYSPTTALTLARENPNREIVFLSVGFETTVGPAVSIVEEASQAGVRNVSLLTAFKTVPSALRTLLADPDIEIDAFLCPAHVSAIIGSRAYEPVSGSAGVPCVIAGFEPLDILLGIKGILDQIVAGESRVVNQYTRVVRENGNPKAQALIARMLEPIDARWRGIGVIPSSGLGLRSAYRTYDAARKHGLTIAPGIESPGCRCGDVIKGKLKPPECPLFGKRCTPDDAVGPCMVSAEGSCAAHFKYLRVKQS
jgi:hydrogenase expression/formation protein HypD